MATIETKIRLYVGGLPSQITAKQLEGRFASFGKVSAINVIPSKAQSADLSCRGFAYVEFCPKDDQSLQRCLSLVSRHFVAPLIVSLSNTVSNKPHKFHFNTDFHFSCINGGHGKSFAAVQWVQMAWRGLESRNGFIGAYGLLCIHLHALAPSSAMHSDSRLRII